MTASYLQPETMPDLFYGSEERVRWDDYLAAALWRSRYRTAEQRVSSSLDNEQFRRELEGFDFSFARPLTLVCAPTRAILAYAHDGMHAFREKPTIYVSEDTHVAWHKVAHRVALGRSAVRLVVADDQGRMDVTALVATFEADRLIVCTPIMIVATAGTAPV